MNLVRKFISLFFLFGIVQAQESMEVLHEDDPILKRSYLTVRNVYIQGNKITKPYIVLRELELKKGSAYSISSILTGLQTSRQNLMNTALFVDAQVDFTNWYNDSLDLRVEVKERWYYFPLPYLKPADRNWNVWLNDYNLNPNRVNYGMKFIGRNITGRNDRLNAWLINGYTQRLALKYYNPFSDNSLRHGWGVDVSYARNREVNFNTGSNKQLFFKDPDQFIRQQFYFGGLYSYRKGSVTRHYFRAGIQRESIADTVAALNAEFYGSGVTKVVYPEFRYTFHYYDVDYIPYPLRGNLVELDLVRKGLGGKVNLTQLSFTWGKYFKLPKKWYWSSFLEANLRIPFDQPYFNQLMLGYNDSYLRGLEYFVVDGVAGGYIRNTIGKEFFTYQFKTGLSSKTYSTIPFRFYIKGYGDVGYVYNKRPPINNLLNNKFMYTGGVGIDIVTIYDLVLRIEYSFNQLNQSGLFLHKADARN